MLPNTYDLAGNRTQVSETWGNPSLHFMYPTNISYLYDSLNRLTTESRTEWEYPLEWFYNYDSVGNRTQMVYVYEGVFTTINNYAYNNLNQLTSNGSNTYTYDNNGNEITRGSNSLGWNYENLMTSYSSTINYLYDSLGKRVWKQNNTNYTRYFFDGINPLMEKGSSNNSTFTTSAIYTLAPGVIKEIVSVHQNGTDYFYHYDPIGNVLFISDTSGNINTDYGQDGFGNVYLTYGPTSTNSYHLTTKKLDPDINLYYFSARWYDPSVGRFVSEEPLELDGPNLYQYGLNNPVNGFDPDGLFFMTIPCEILFGEWLEKNWPTWDPKKGLCETEGDKAYKEFMKGVTKVGKHSYRNSFICHRWLAWPTVVKHAINPAWQWWRRSKWFRGEPAPEIPPENDLPGN